VAAIIIDTSRVKAEKITLEKGQKCGHCHRRIRKNNKAITMINGLKQRDYFCLKCTALE